MFDTILMYGIVFVALSLYSGLVIAVFSGRAYSNGYRAGVHDAGVDQHRRSSVRLVR
jgi:hypothetical protein